MKLYYRIYIGHNQVASSDYSSLALNENRCLWQNEVGTMINCALHSQDLNATNRA